MERKNCWEVNKCARQPGGDQAKELGVCPTAKAVGYNGINRGNNGGRFCWAVVGTFCNEKQQGTFAEKLINCLECDFLKKVNEEEGRDFVLLPLKYR